MFRFILKYGLTEVEVFPLYSSGLSKRWQKDEEGNFYKVELSDDLKFINEDFDVIYSQPSGTAFELLVEKFVNGSWVEFYDGYFNLKLAKEVDVDNKKIVFQIKENGKNRDIKKILDNKVNIIPKSPPIVRLNTKKRDILQLYFQTAGFVTNILGGNYWEEPVTDIFNRTDTYENDYGFEVIISEGYCEIVFGSWVTIPGSGTPFGTWVGSPNVSFGCEWEFANATMIIEPASFSGQNVYRATELGNNTVVGYRTATSGPFGIYYGDPFLLTSPKFRLDSQLIMARVLTVSATVSNYGGASVASIVLPAEDITGQKQYTRAAPVTIPEALILKNYAKTTTPTEYGLKDVAAGEYYVRPLPAEELALPISRNSWQLASFWFVYDDEVRAMEDVNFSDRLIKDNYLMADVIKVLLTGTGITHEADFNYSSVMYGGAVKGFIWHPVLTPKTNFLVGDYDTPAKKAEVTLKDIFEMLRKAFKCYWFIDSSDRLRIEHISFFENGGSYAGPQIGLDTTVTIESRNGKPWSFNTNKFTFDGSDIPERQEFSWMDEQTLSFTGRPIVSIGADVEEGLVIKEQVSLFSTDLDFSLYNKADISKDGFMLTLCTRTDAFNYAVPLVEVDNVPQAKKVLQNGWASMEYLQNLLFVYSAPTPVLLMNEANVNAVTVSKSKKQTISVPSPNTFNEFTLVKTGLGNGIVEEASLNLSSGMLVLNLKI